MIDEFKKYTVHIETYSFFSSVPFGDLGFSSGYELREYFVQNDVCDDSPNLPSIAPSKDDALEWLSQKSCRIYEAPTIGGYQIDVEIPVVEEICCDEDIEKYDPSAEILGIETVAVAKLR